MSRKVRRLHSSALNYFMAVVDEGSFRSAARRLRIAPSAVNRHVLLLEEELGFQLFERGPTTLKLSAAGEIVRRHCAETLRSFERASESLDALRGIHSGIVRVASSESFAAEFVPQLCSSFSRDYPGVEIRIAVASSDQVVGMIEADEADIGFAFGVEELNQGAVVAAFDLPIGAIVGPRHPLADRLWVTVSQCFEHQVVFPDANISFRRKLDQVSALFLEKHLAGIEAGSPRLMVGIARLGGHVAFLTPLGIERDLAQGDLKFLPIREDGLMPDRCVLLRSFGSAERFAAQRFLLLAKDELEIYVTQAIGRISKSLLASRDQDRMGP